MKSDHRHELKTNELADWIAHLPEWIQENRTTLIATGVAVVVILGVYFAKFYRKDTALVRQQLRLTSLVMQLPITKENAAMGLSQGQDQSMAFIPVADTLEDFSGTAKTGDMAAQALIKRAEALRAELHYRVTEPTREEISDRIALAQVSYNEAIERGKSSPALTATAKFGLGLCQEELGNFDQATEIYRELAQDEAYAGTTGQAAAAERLGMMDDYRGEFVFKPAPPEPAGTLPSGLSVTPEGILPSATPSGPNDTAAGMLNIPDINAADAMALVEAMTTDANTSTPAVPEANAPATN